MELVVWVVLCETMVEVCSSSDSVMHIVFVGTVSDEGYLLVCCPRWPAYL